MSTSNIVSIVIGVLAVVLLVVALVSILRAIQARLHSSRVIYSVGRQEARRSARLGFLRAALLGILGLILLGVSGIVRWPGSGQADADTEAPTRAGLTPAQSTLPVVTQPPLNMPTSTGPTSTLAPLFASVTPAPIPTATPLPSPTATTVPSALVNSEVGLYLREAPGGTQEVELLPNGAVLVLLPGRETVGDVEWQQVRTPSGLVGWVAVPFISYQGTP